MPSTLLALISVCVFDNLFQVVNLNLLTWMVLMMETTATQWQERREGALKMLMMMRKQCAMLILSGRYGRST